MIQKIFRKKDVHELSLLFKSISCEQIFIVHGNKSYINSGAKAFIDDLFEGKELNTFSEFSTNPQLSDVRKGIELFKQKDNRLIVAIGGGSALDMSKLISVFAHQKADLNNIVLGKSLIINSKTQLLAIPTTAGTGAEATHFAVVYIDKTKYSVGHQAMLPEYVYLSSDFSLSASSYLTACTGLDAFCQAVESVWSVNANSESLDYAIEAIDITWNNLQKAVTQNEVSAKEKMQEAAYLAGKAINITKTTAPHALSYAFTSYYGIPHGHAVAISLPFFAKYNYELNDSDCVDNRGAEAVKKRIELISAKLKIDIKEAHISFEKFFKSIGINIQLKELIKELDTGIILNNVNFERLNNNPRKVSKENIAELLKLKQ